VLAGLQKSVISRVVRNQRAAQQINGREAETATLFGTSLVSLTLRGGGFRPRHLSRLKEIYIGVAKDVDSRILKHAGYYTGGAKTIAHWDFESNYIKRYVYPDRFNSKNRASQTAHYLEDVCNIPNGYEVFLTCGI